jgi:hypothetical protein
LHRLLPVGGNASVLIDRMFVLMVNHVGIFSEVHLLLKVVEERTVNFVLRVGKTVVLAESLLRLFKLFFGSTHVVVAEQLRLLFILLRRKSRHPLPLEVVEVCLVAPLTAFLHQGFTVFPVALSHSGLLILRQRVEDCVDRLHLLLFKSSLFIRNLQRCLIVVPLLLLFKHLSLLVALHVNQKTFIEH